LSIGRPVSFAPVMKSQVQPLKFLAYFLKF